MTPKFSLTLNTNDAGEIARVIAAMHGHVTVTATTDDDADNAPASGYVAPERDSSGLPWDARIHAKSKATKADGTWKAARGVDAATVAAVEAELRAMLAPPMPTQQPVTMTMQPAQPTPQIQPGVMMQPAQMMPQVQPGVMMPQVQQAPAAPEVAPQVQQAPAAPAALDFNSFMLGLQKGMQQNLVDLNVLNWVVGQLNSQFGTQFTQITDLVQRPEMIAQAVYLLQSQGKWVA